MSRRQASDREAVIARLQARLGGVVPEGEVAEAVHAAFDDLAAHARFHAYVPVLAERAALARLAEHADAATQRLSPRADASPPDSGG